MASSQQQQNVPQGPPYPPQAASLGGIPNVHTDIPISAVFLFLFILGAAAHMAIFKLNMKKGHKFFMSAMLFGFCMCRIVTTTLRIAWSTRPRNIRLGMAATIFVAVGTIILFLVNLVFAQRIIRAQHARWGWNKGFDIFFKVLFVCIILTLILLIFSVIQSFYTLSKDIHRIDRDIQLYGATFNAVVPFLPIPMVIIGLVIPRRVRVDKFGKGRFRTKVFVLLAAAILLSIGAAWRAAVAWLPPVPRTESRWYLSKTCFYIFNFTVDFLVVVLYAFVRVDMRFYVPDGAEGAGSYSGVRKWNRQPLEEEEGTTVRVYSEEELFDDAATLAESLRYPSTCLDYDGASGKWLLKRQSTGSIYTNASSRWSQSRWSQAESIRPLPDDIPPLPERPPSSRWSQSRWSQVESIRSQPEDVPPIPSRWSQPDSIRPHPEDIPPLPEILPPLPSYKASRKSLP